MSDLRLLLIDDNALIAERTRIFVDAFEHYTVADIAYKFAEAERLIAQETYDLALVDINLEEEKNGFDVARLLTDKGIPFVYVTSYADQKTLDSAFEWKPLLYIVKPFTKEILLANLELVRKKHLLQEQITVQDGKTLVKLDNSKVYYIKSEGNYCSVFTVDKTFLLRANLSFWLDVDAQKFVQVHRSYVINIDKLQALGKSAVLSNGSEVPVSGSFKDNLRALMERG